MITPMKKPNKATIEVKGTDVAVPSFNPVEFDGFGLHAGFNHGGFAIVETQKKGGGK